MRDCVITVKSQTMSMAAKRALNGERIRADIVSVDPALTKYGCAFGIRIPCEDAERILQILDRNNIAHGDVIGRGGMDR